MSGLVVILATLLLGVAPGAWAQEGGLERDPADRVSVEP